MKILWTGDIVGSPGRRVFKSYVKHLKDCGEINASIANGENSAAGSGITEALSKELFDAGADVITLGDHVWNQKGFDQYIASDKRILRPLNLPETCPGVGITTVQTPISPITVISVIGRTFMNPARCPFLTIDEALKRLPANCGPIFVEIHAEATSEKIALGRYLDGRVTAVAGTHTHVQTSDAGLLPNGTAYITDLGMTGPIDSVIGRECKPVIHKFLTGMPTKFDVADGPAKIEGVVIDVDRVTGKAVSIQSFRHCEG